jgi:uncharacterized protein YcbK (DUF882 family)
MEEEQFAKASACAMERQQVSMTWKKSASTKRAPVRNGAIALLALDFALRQVARGVPIRKIKKNIKTTVHELGVRQDENSELDRMAHNKKRKEIKQVDKRKSSKVKSLRWENLCCKSLVLLTLFVANGRQRLKLDERLSCE